MLLASSMQRITITLDEELVTALDQVIAECGYQNRSEAIRDLARAGIAQRQEHSGEDARAGVAALVYVYDHQERGMAKRLTGSFHQHHDLSIASMHVHLDHVSCMEVAVLRGAFAGDEYSPISALREFTGEQDRVDRRSARTKPGEHAHDERTISVVHWISARETSTAPLSAVCGGRCEITA